MKDSCENIPRYREGKCQSKNCNIFCSDTIYQYSVKDKDKFIEVMCGYNTTKKDVEANISKVHVQNYP